MSRSFVWQDGCRWPQRTVFEPAIALRRTNYLCGVIVFHHFLQMVAGSSKQVWLFVWFETVFLYNKPLSDVRLIVPTFFAHRKLDRVMRIRLFKDSRLVAACIALSLFGLQSFAKGSLL